MIVVTEDVLSEMTQVIVDTLDPERVILFGSRAGGDAASDSDVDLLIVIRQPFGKDHNRWSEISRVRSALHRFHVPKDILLYSADEVRRFGKETGHIVATSLAQGKTLYERP